VGFAAEERRNLNTLYSEVLRLHRRSKMEAQDQGSIRTIVFDGKDKTKYAEWADKVVAAAQLKGYRDQYTKDLKIPSTREYEEGKWADTTEVKAEDKKLYENNEKAFSWLILCKRVGLTGVRVEARGFNFVVSGGLLIIMMGRRVALG